MLMDLQLVTGYLQKNTKKQYNGQKRFDQSELIYKVGGYQTYRGGFPPLLMCKGVCNQAVYEKKGTVRVGMSEKETHKRCSICCVFIKWSGVFCPCCGVKLKMSPRNNKARTTYAKSNEIRKRYKTMFKNHITSFLFR